jgi:NAD(P)H-flavin reductase
MKSRYSPLAVAFGASHEQLNIWHQYSAKVFYTLIVTHVILYINFFLQKGIFEKRMQELDVILGVNSMIYLTILTTTSLALIRHWSYRLFFVLHLVIGIGLPILLFFHAHHMRIYVVEALTLFIIDVILRKLDTVTSYATITPVPHTKLVKVKIPVSDDKIHRYQYAPSQHVYINIPAGSRPAGTMSLSIHELLYNPYTIAEVGEKDITLVLRALSGPTSKALAALTNLSKAKPPLNVEGPLGCTQHFPNLIAKYDRVLLVAGGVGATFTLPIYKALVAQLESESSSLDRVKMIWTMRSAAEANWTDTKAINGDPNVAIFITRSKGDDVDHTQEPIPTDGSVELDELLPKDEDIVVSGARERPDLGRIVEEMFRSGRSNKVAVLVCGPGGLAREVRAHLGGWIAKGRDIWFHDESFGF